jgi:hypothetical protein
MLVVQPVTLIKIVRPASMGFSSTPTIYAMHVTMGVRHALAPPPAPPASPDFT